MAYSRQEATEGGQREKRWYKRRIMAVGEPVVPLDSTFPSAVVFIVGLRTKPGTHEGVRVPIGTGFIVSVPSAALPNRSYLYIATAAHVVRAENETFVRLNTKDGGVTDLQAENWVIHSTEDVAVHPFYAPETSSWRHVPRSVFLDRVLQDNPEAEPHLGDPVYFLGLLAGITAMAEANVPMVRSGTLGRLYQPNVPITWPDGTKTRVVGHLIDCRSYAGFSGSPVYAQFSFTRHVTVPTIPGGAIGDLSFEVTALIGLIAGHFDDWERAEVTGDFFGEVRSRMNTGVGVVTPVEALRDTLELEELAEMRREHDERAKPEEEPSAVADSLVSDEGRFTKQEFEEALRRTTRKVSPRDEGG